MTMGFLFGHVKRTPFKKPLELRNYYIDDCLFEIIQGTRHGPRDRIIKLNGVPITFCVLLELEAYFKAKLKYHQAVVDNLKTMAKPGEH